MTSTIPAALVKLTALFAAVRVPGLTVSDGPIFDLSGPYLCVGWDETESSPGVIVTPTPSDYGGYSDREEFDVLCLLSWWVGDNNTTEARRRAYDAYDQVIAAVESDLTLGNQVVSAMVNGVTYTASIADTGARADIRFTIHVSAFK